MTGNADAASNAPDGAGQHPSDPIKLVTRTVRSPDGGKPLVMEFETRVATGKAGEALALEQAAAIREVLSWIACNREPSDNGQAGRLLTRSPPPRPEATIPQRPAKLRQERGQPGRQDSTSQRPFAKKQ